MPRGALISWVDERSASIPIVFLSAGPGWGKTTLLAQWASESQRPFAWVSVDENDNDPIVLLTYIAVALDRVSPLDVGVFDALASPGVSVEGTVVPRLGAAMATSEQAAVLVLDDLHVLNDAQGLDAIRALSRHVPPGSQLALSARGDPAVPPAVLRAGGLALEIGPDELRMDAGEAHQLLSAAGLHLPDHEVAELIEHTEGWSAGLYLAALSIRARSGRAKGAATFSGSDRLVADYLRSELLAHLSADEIRFLTRTAVLERLSAPLCDAVLESDGSAAILESLESLQPVPGTAGSASAVVSLPPSVPGAAPCPAGAGRAGRWCLSSSVVRPIGAWRTGSWRRPSATRRRPTTSTRWRGCWSVVSNPRTRAGVSPPLSAGSSGSSSVGRLSGTPQLPCLARS